MSDGDRNRSQILLVALAATCLVVVTVGLAVGVAAPGATFGSGDASGGSAHVEPSAASGTSNLGGIGDHLSKEIVRNARVGSLNLSREQINRTRRTLAGTEYESLIEQYSGIAEATNRENQSQVFRQLREDQVEYVTAVDRYWRTYDRYQEVRRLEDNGTDPEDIPVGQDDRTVDHPSRYLAHELEYQWSRANYSRVDLIESYRLASYAASTDFSPSIESVNETQRDLDETQQAVRDREFVRTSMRARSVDPNASFTDPLIVQGRLTAENGSMVDDATVRVAVDNRSVTTRTNDTGHFTLPYRPTRLPTNASEVRVEFVPSNATTYARSSATVDVSVSQVEPEIAVEPEPSAVGYNDTIAVSGWIGTEESHAPSVPFYVTVGGHLVERNETEPDGRINVSATLPADVDTGEQPVRVIVRQEGRALAPAAGETPIDVSETPTRLSVAAEKVADEAQTLRVSGRLKTIDGFRVKRQQVGIDVNGTVVGTARTGGDGEFQTTVSVPERVLDGGVLGGTNLITVRGDFAGDGTNLGASRGASAVFVGSEADVAVLGGGVGLVVVAVGAALLLRGSNRRAGSIDVDTGDLQVAESERGSGRADPASLFAHARERLSAGDPGPAVWAGYAATRGRISDRLDDAPGGTHWEFYRACREADLDEEVLDGLRRVTELYERAAFTPESIDPDTAERALDRMGRLAADAGDRDGSDGPGGRGGSDPTGD